MTGPMHEVRRHGAHPHPARRANAHPSNRRQRHDDAVIQAEIRLLALALRPCGLAREDALTDAAMAAKEHDGSFQRALSTAQRSIARA